jgi:epoxyqueuosine reductase
MELAQTLIKCAQAEGFVLAGVVDIELALNDPQGSFHSHLSHYDRWIEAGYAGSMEYLVRGRDRRADPRAVFPPAQSILSVAIPYPRTAAGASNQNLGPKYARYLQGPDYHLVIAEKLERAMKAAQISCKANDLQSAPLPLEWKICVDTSAVLERTWAALAGLGWIGKNTLLMHPQHGSYLFLAEVLINQKTGQGPKLHSNLCGNCQKCLTSCPTKALERPGVLNSNRCIAYLTLEKRGELNVEPQVQKKMGPWIAGCDLCQEVCPFNLKPVRNETTQGDSSSLMNPQNATLLHHWQGLLEESPETYKARVKKSAMKRVKPAQFSRNLAIALRNALQSEVLSAQDRLALRPLIEKRLRTEADTAAQAEWNNTLSQFDP